MSDPEWKKIFGKSNITITSVSREHKHLLSHQTIYAKFYSVNLKKKLSSKNGFLEVAEKDLKKYAVPKLIENFLKKG